MPHTKDDAVFRTSGKSWHCPSLSDPRTQIRLLHFRPGSDDDEISVDVEIFDLEIPRGLALSLMVEDESGSFENWLRTRSGSAEGPKVLPAPSRLKRFTIGTCGAHIITRDGEARLSVALKVQNSATKCTPNVPNEMRATSDGSKALDSILAEHGLIPIFTDDDISVLACREAIAEDIILRGDHSTLVLRAQDDGLSFIIVGQAVRLCWVQYQGRHC